MSNITTSLFQEMVQAAATRLGKQAEYVNSLNVFPVPDGDTGTNMSMTMDNGAKEVADKPASTVGEVGQILSKGLLMGARGNSGVITSQLFRGFGQSIKSKEELTGKDLAQAFQMGVEVAYKAVMKPVEGTILTVSRGAATAALKKADLTDNAIEVMQAALDGAKGALAKTPDLLPVLKEVGVVDSGGQGLVFIYEGFLSALNGDYVASEDFKATPANMSEMIKAEHHKSVAGHVATEDITYGYCTEIMVALKQGPTYVKEFNYDEFQGYLSGLGDSLLVVNDDEIVKVHVHTEDPGLVMQEGLKYGSLIKIKVDNMRNQHEAQVQKIDNEPTKAEAKEFGLIAVVAGDGLAEIFKAQGVDYVISGGQTMNPSTEDIVKAIEAVNAKQVIILPNNKNIFMAAQSAAEVVDIPAAVVETRTIPQGFTSLLAFDPSKTLEDNVADMTASLSDVVSGSVTLAVRDTTIDGLDIHENDFLGMVDGSIVVSNPDMAATLKTTFDHMIDEDSEIVTIFIGEDGSSEVAQGLADYLEETYEDIEVELHQGDQPVYPYLMSVE
ncbi:dihydroxyacetone kinase family protein [Streptococcus equi subsp. zooepidemicus SzS31A1]|uniref:Dihydroxyacetone kinase family protein n=2 Tax=Streptococcus equi subsp. zooepidemicus TaxID=40041 RepID=A0ABR4RSL3_STRSZ|nr:DAK2 domain-containing protein [Streptococcus equi]KIS16407.1 dihydroxyacetone kinase family protein [Streptococcus equi subsp. zooepidemicus Sz4is]HEL0121212.1 DAK2 domain-containing protein [Streptococcus equi subsp. zooepidemicus]KDE01875.1 dihydroxyacetone kinase family protein [Streptococcus equi subsp. zooepidemicus SzS31A1]KIS04687.1 dihydroxyacetone kinase family protein [Streptococcus equi subsp. zooepidemicus Sz12is]HEL0125280.1 DAK2 domain-containing protein [Streptococcus equi s